MTATHPHKADRPHDRDNPDCWCQPVVIRNCGIDMSDEDAEVVANGKHVIFDHCTFTGGEMR